MSPSTKFQNKLTILIFWTKFTQKGYLRSKSEKVNITTEFCTFKLEENNDIFPAGGDALVYLAEPKLVRTYVMTNASGHIEIFQSHVAEKIFQNLRVRLKFNTRSAMKIKLFVAREIQYFELGIFSFNSHVYYLTRGFIASTRAFNLLTHAFNLPTPAFSLPTRAFNLSTRAFSALTREFELVTGRFELVTREFELITREFELVTREFELLTRGFELVARRFELVTRGFELVTRNS